MISLGRAYNWTEPVCGTHSDWENFYSLSQQMCPAGYSIQGSKCSSIFWVYQSIWGWGIKNTFIFRCALFVLPMKHNSYISFWTPEKNSVNSNPTTGTSLTTHFSSFPLKVSEWSGLVSNQHQWSLFLSESCFLTCCRRKLDGSSIAKLISQVFSGLVVVWFYIIFGFQILSLSFCSSSNFHGAVAKELSKCEKVFHCVSYLLYTVSQRELFKRLSLFKAKRAVCIMLWWKLSYKDITVLCNC